MKPVLIVRAVASALTLSVILGCAPPRSSRITIGAKNFTEQVVLGELLAQEIEAVTGQRVNRRFYLAGSYICQQALISGRIDGYVEYTGAALTAILKQPLPPIGQRDPASVLRQVSDLYAARYKVTVGPPLGFEDTFAMVIRGDDARRLGIKTISDAVEPATKWRLGVGYEFEERPDGLRGLEAEYGLRFAGPPRVMDLGLLYRVLSQKQVDMVAGNSTDGPIRAFGFVVLDDDKHYFPPYEAVPVVLADSLQRHPEIKVAEDRIAGKVTADEVRAMNDAVDGQHRDVGGRGARVPDPEGSLTPVIGIGVCRGLLLTRMTPAALEEVALGEMLSDPKVLYVLGRDARAGCFDFRVERGESRW